MRILLLMPDARIHRLSLGSVSLSFREAPLTLTTLAALVPAELGAEIRVVDESIESIPFDEAFDLVGISCLTGTALRAYELADHFRGSGALVILGGVHVTLLPEEAAEHADAIVIGDAEDTWPQAVRDAVAGELKPVYRGEPTTLADLPLPRRDLQKRGAYAMPQTVFATRGCRGTCDFCTVPALRAGWRTRPVHDVIDEVRQLPGRRFVFNDVSLTEDRDYALELFSGLVPLRKKWGGLSTVRIADDPEMLDVMKRSGCVYLLVGFESVANLGLRSMGKTFSDADRYPTVVAELHDRGIIVQGCFIFGLDSDTHDVFAETVDRVNELKIDIPRYAIYTPYPGTRAFDRLKAEGRILHEHWAHYDTQHVVFRPAQMSARELDAGFVDAYRRTFGMGSVLRRTCGSRRFPITFIGNLAYRIYIHRLQQEADRVPACASTGTTGIPRVETACAGPREPGGAR